MNKMMNIAAAGAFLLLAACGKKDEPVAKPTLAISPALETLAFAAGEDENYTFEVTTNQSQWDAVSDQEWCKITKNARDNSFTVTALDNEAPALPAHATITVSAGKAEPLTLTATLTAAEYDIYVAGHYRGPNKYIACYWKNGVRTDLTDGSENARLTSITASEGSVYISGEHRSKPCYWKDGEPFELDGYIVTCSIAVENGTVYVLGFGYYWKDNEIVQLNSPDFYGEDMAVSDGKVYVAGEIQSRAASWTDGKAEPLPVPEGAIDSFTESIAASDGSVYIGGLYMDKDNLHQPCYWKDGTLTTLDAAESYGGTVVAICVNNGKVYAAGESGGVCYWADGKRMPLEISQDISNIAIVGIAVGGGKVYVAGSYESSQSVRYPCYWVDGKMVDMKEDGIVPDEVIGIVLVRK